MQNAQAYTTVMVSRKNAELLHELKKRGESYNDVIARLLATQKAVA